MIQLGATIKSGISLTLVILLLTGSAYIGRIQISQCSKKTEVIDTVVKPVSAAQFYRNLRSTFAVDDISDGFWDIQIQIWIDDPGNLYKLLVFKKQNHNWTSMIYYYRWIETDSFKVVFQKDSRMPAHGWEHFARQMERLHIYQVDDPTTVSGFSSCTDGGIALMIEIAQNHAYKRCLFPCFWTLQAIPYQKSLAALLRLTEKEFGYNLIEH